MASSNKLFKELAPYIESGPSPQGEYRIRCPIHGERRASASVNPEKNAWYCQVCATGGSIRQLVQFLRELPENDPRKAKATGNVFDIDTARSKAKDPGEEVVERLNEAKVRGWHERLMSNPKLLSRFMKKRGLSKRIIERYKIGYDERSKRFTIPVYDRGGELVNVRRYSLGSTDGQKVRNARGHGSPPRLYPMDQLDADRIILVEGELDALALIDLGFPAVTGTGGAKRWDPEWSIHFSDKIVYVIYDNDKDGRVGAKRAAKAISKYTDAVVVAPPLLPQEEHSDATDWILSGGNAKKLKKFLKRAVKETVSQRKEEVPEPAEAEVVDVQVIGSMDSRTNGRPLSMSVMITGRKDPTYSIPHRVHLECTMDAGPKCKGCPMLNEWDGDHSGVISDKDINFISQFIDARKASAGDVVRSAFGVVKCNRLEIHELENTTVEELFVMSSVDQEGDTDYTQRRIYNIGSDGSTRTNTEAKVVGTTVASPRDRRNEFFSWSLEESVTSLDNFHMDEETRARLSVFQPSRGQSPLDKCWEIATDLASNVTGIYRRERLHIAMDLVWHSILHFPFEGKVTSRGWLELLIVGDTRTGKSETSHRLTNHYGLGHVIGCEGATFAGLVGGVKEVGTSRTITWGEITLNDRRLVVLDEASGLSEELIGQLSDVRSRGKAQITKIETAMTNARARSIWISNPRKNKFVNEKKIDGVDIIRDLIGNDEDIARFDFAMSVSSEDVTADFINDPDKPTVPHVYTSDLCRDLVLWAWSRKPDQVVWDEDAYRLVFSKASELGKTFIEDPPLIQGADVRQKVARLSVAMAARTFSTDETGELVVVKAQHVLDATEFMKRLYSYDNFGYLRNSQRASRNQEIARKSRKRIKKWLLESPNVFEFLIGRQGSFRSQDLEEMAHMMRDEVNIVLGKLSDAKMIRKEKSQIVIEPVLARLLKEIEDEQRARARSKRA